jgi:hypothetical protein
VESIKCSEVTAREETEDTKTYVFLINTACVGNAHECNGAGLVMNKRKERFVIDGYDGARRNIDTTGDVKGLEKTVLIPQAPNNLINLLKLRRDINGRYKGDAYCMKLFDEEGKLYLHAKTGKDGFLTCKYTVLAKNELRIRNMKIITLDGERHFTAKERTRAAEVYPLCAKLGQPGFNALH